MRNLATVVLAAGLGKRMKSKLAKPLHLACGRTLIERIVGLAQQLNSQRTVIVVSHQKERFEEVLKPFGSLDFAVQAERLGTAHALMMAEPALKGFEGDVLVLYGDTPLLTRESLLRLLEHHWGTEAAATLLTALMADPYGYGRVVRSGEGGPVQRVVEERDATPEERAIREINAGTYVFRASLLFPTLHRVSPDNDQKEYYLTDVPHILIRDGHRVEAVTVADPAEILGINSRIQLAEVERVLRDRIRQRHLLAGVTMTDPNSVFIDEQVTIGQDTILEPFCVLKGNSAIGQNCMIGPSATLIDTVIGDNCLIMNAFLQGESIPCGSQWTGERIRPL